MSTRCKGEEHLLHFRYIVNSSLGSVCQRPLQNTNVHFNLEFEEGERQDLKPGFPSQSLPNQHPSPLHHALSLSLSEINS